MYNFQFKKNYDKTRKLIRYVNILCFDLTFEYSAHFAHFELYKYICLE